VIEHRYTPGVGARVGTDIGSTRQSEAAVQAHMRKYCVDRELVAAVERTMKAEKATSPPYTEERIHYVLRTGANWAGPIKDFRLVVDKGDVDSLVSFCGSNVKKIGPTQFEMRRQDFTPDGDLAILILKKADFHKVEQK
jgi:hypothetical protein